MGRAAYLPGAHHIPATGAARGTREGVRRTKTMGDRRIRLCKACRRKFTPKYQQGPERTSEDENKDVSVVQESDPLNEVSAPVDMPSPAFQPATDLVREPGATE